MLGQETSSEGQHLQTVVEERWQTLQALEVIEMNNYVCKGKMYVLGLSLDNMVPYWTIYYIFLVSRHF